MIAVVGAAVCTPEEAETAAAVGRLLAERGAVVLCGGRGGIMEAACRGARQAGGLTVGLLPGQDDSEANAYLSLAIATGLGQARNAVIAQAGCAMIAIGGRYGTLSEIALALKLGKPVISLASWGLADAKGGQAEMAIARTPEEAVELALARAQAFGKL